MTNIYPVPPPFFILAKLPYHRVLISLLFFLLAGNATAGQLSSPQYLPTVSLPEETVLCLQSNDWGCALDYLVPAYEEQGQNSNLHYYIGYCLQQQANHAISQQKLQEGAELLQQAVEYVNDKASLYADLGYTWFQLSEYEQSYWAFSDAAALAPGNAAYAEMLGRISYITSDFKNAQHHWQKALELDPENTKLHKRLAQLDNQLSITREGTTEVNHTFSITFDAGMDRDIYTAVWEILEDARYELGVQLDLWPKRTISVLLLTRQKFTSVAAAPFWSEGIYEGQIKIPIADFNAAHLRDVIYHEYMHALLHDAMANRCPWWLNEGLAQFFQPGQHYKDKMLQFAESLLAQNNNLDPSQLPGRLGTESQARTAYALALSAVQHIVDRFTLVVLRTILFDMSSGLSFDTALAQNTAYSVEELHQMWNNATAP